MKYYKAEDVIEAYNQAVTLLVESEMEEFNLGDFTECSFNTTQIKLIARMIESLPTIEVSEDCISRSELIERFIELIERAKSPYLKRGIRWAIGYAQSAPSVVPSRAEGEWIGTEYDGYADGNPVYYEWICSACKCVVEDEEPTWNFCPNCGAKMKG